jgi:cytochrome c-type biogenesis protein CcmF
MTTELGHFALILALMVAILQTVMPLVGAHRKNTAWMNVAEPAAVVQFLLVAVSFAALVWAFVSSDFSLRLVTLNSHSLKPLFYKITGVWANHEGSVLLWVLILTAFGAGVAVFGRNLPPTLRARVLGIQGLIGVAFIGYSLFTSNPFLRLARPPMDGEGMNPLLQDVGLALHPPFLYLGYVGLSVSFSFAIAALLEGRVDAAWARWVRPWTLAAWVFLSFGIGLGSWWAYYELGWGGFWFWDPVENSSFMPWLFAVALLHSAIVVEKREALKSWTILLAILAFGFSLMGAFLVRSGVLTSVHAFANDPARGVALLLILLFFVGGALTLYSFRAHVLQAKGVFGVVSRESALVFNNVLLAVSALVVFVGTMWPLTTELFTGRKVSVGPPFFNAAFTPFGVLIVALLPIGTLLPWKRATLKRALKPLWGVLVLAISLGALAYAIQTGNSALGPIGLVLAAWLIGGSAMDLWQKTGRGGLASKLSRMARLPRADWGRIIAHAGLGVMIMAMTSLMAWETEDIRVAYIGEPYPLGPYEITLNGIEQAEGVNYFTTIADITVRRDGEEVARLFPEKRVYPAAGMPTTEAAIASSLFRDIYVVVGDAQDDGGWTVRSYIKPMANWIWGGMIIMALGGIISLTDRRYRVAAGARRQTPKAEGVPAE